MPAFQFSGEDIVLLERAERENLAVLEVIANAVNCGVDCVNYQGIAEQNIAQLRKLRDTFGPTTGKSSHNVAK